MDFASLFPKSRTVFADDFSRDKGKEVKKDERKDGWIYGCMNGREGGECICVNVTDSEKYLSLTDGWGRCWSRRGFCLPPSLSLF